MNKNRSFSTDQTMDVSYYSTGAHRDKYDESDSKILLVIFLLLAASLMISVFPMERIRQDYQYLLRSAPLDTADAPALVTGGGVWETSDDFSAFPGLRVTRPPEYARKYFGFPQGMYVTASEIESLQEGDIIITVNGEMAPEEETFRNCVEAAPGDTVEFRIYRSEAFETISVNLGK